MTQPKPSKSARKREQLQLQQLGERLIELTEEELQALPIDERLREAVLAASKIRAHGALRRQKQLIGKLMRNCDPVPIQRALDARGAEDRRAKRVFADAERWRDRIVTEGGEAVRLFCDQSGASAEARAGSQAGASRRHCSAVSRVRPASVSKRGCDAACSGRFTTR